VIGGLNGFGGQVAAIAEIFFGEGVKLLAVAVTLKNAPFRGNACRGLWSRLDLEYLIGLIR
jgi:hypothetical protein